MFQLSMATCIITLQTRGPQQNFFILILMSCFRKITNSKNYHNNHKDVAINRTIDKLSQPNRDLENE